MRRLLVLAGFLAPLLAPQPAAAADDPLGRWDREDGLGGIRLDRCGDALCGFVTWLRDPAGPGRVGERVFYDLRPTVPGTWSGQAHNPEDGREYAGTVQLDGGRLVAKGCVFGGLICKRVVMLRGR